MIFSRGKVRKYQNFMFEGSILDVTYECVYLGVNFYLNTSFIKAIERHIELSVLCLPLLPKLDVYHYCYIYCLSYLIMTMTMTMK